MLSERDLRDRRPKRPDTRGLSGDLRSDHQTVSRVGESCARDSEQECRARRHGCTACWPESREIFKTLRLEYGVWGSLELALRCQTRSSWQMPISSMRRARFRSTASRSSCRVVGQGRGGQRPADHDRPVEYGAAGRLRVRQDLSIAAACSGAVGGGAPQYGAEITTAASATGLTPTAIQVRIAGATVTLTNSAAVKPGMYNLVVTDITGSQRTAKVIASAAAPLR